MSDDIAATVICLWCNRVQAWGKADISYEVCLACAPRVADEVRTLHAGRTGAGPSAATTYGRRITIGRQSWR